MAREHEMRLQPWGTLEELLLACAVKRHGTKSWESIAMELKNRTTAFHSVTPQNCLDYFNDLKRRFKCQNDADLSSLVDELRKIRIAELREDVEQSEVKIMSLEMKVKRMEEEEREKSLKEEVDLKRERKEENMLSPEFLAGKSIAIAGEDDDDDDDNRSFNESNSTSQKGELIKKNEEAKFKTEPEPIVKSEPDPVQTWIEPDRLVNGKLGLGEDILDNDDNMVVKKERKLSEVVCGLAESTELLLWESKQSSDVQSSASLSKMMKRRRSSRSGGGGARMICSSSSSSGEEAEIDEVSPAMKKISAVQSEPLIKFLGILRSHRLGWFFERRQRSQVFSKIFF